jgi:hypothetical protein
MLFIILVGIPLIRSSLQWIGSARRENAKQGFNPHPAKKNKLYERLCKHVKSINAVETAGIDTSLKLEDFRCRFLILNDAYINLAESVLIAVFRPPWNGMGLGSNEVGGPRMEGMGSLWDALHPGRKGRPEGSDESQDRAKSQIQETITRLSSPHPDERVEKMLKKIFRFL